MDVNKFIPQDFEDLKKYCYHVAGVVGLLMSHILKANDKRALYYADSLGRAMQLTNISRDIAEDFSLQRIYIPQQWLQEKNIDPVNLMTAENQEQSL